MEVTIREVEPMMAATAWTLDATVWARARPFDSGEQVTVLHDDRAAIALTLPADEAAEFAAMAPVGARVTIRSAGVRSNAPADRAETGHACQLVRGPRTRIARSPLAPHPRPDGQAIGLVLAFARRPSVMGVGGTGVGGTGGMGVGGMGGTAGYDLGFAALAGGGRLFLEDVERTGGTEIVAGCGLAGRCVHRDDVGNATLGRYGSVAVAVVGESAAGESAAGESVAATLATLAAPAWPRPTLAAEVEATLRAVPRVPIVLRGVATWLSALAAEPRRWTAARKRPRRDQCPAELRVVIHLSDASGSVVVTAFAEVAARLLGAADPRALGARARDAAARWLYRPLDWVLVGHQSATDEGVYVNLVDAADIIYGSADW
jgi:hypothetical protein